MPYEALASYGGKFRLSQKRLNSSSCFLKYFSEKQTNQRFRRQSSIDRPSAFATIEPQVQSRKSNWDSSNPDFPEQGSLRWKPVRPARSRIRTFRREGPCTSPATLAGRIVLALVISVKELRFAACFVKGLIESLS